MTDADNAPATFAVAGGAYDRFMGRYSRELALRLIEIARSLEPKKQEALRDELFARLESPVGPFTLSARAWAVGGVR